MQPTSRTERVLLPGVKPRAWQVAAHALLSSFRFLVLVWHRRAGKTMFALVELLMAAVALQRQGPPGRFLYVAPELKQARLTAWSYLRSFARAIPGTQIRESELTIVLGNGNTVELGGADNPDSFRGRYFDGVVVDEVADMKPEIWGEVLRPTLMDFKGWAIFIGTPKGLNVFADLYFGARDGKLGSEWGAQLLTYRDTGVIDEGELEALRRDPLMTPAKFAQELECDFSASADDALIPLADVFTAQGRDYDQGSYVVREKVIGVDVARRENGDRSVIAMRQGPIVFPLRKFRGMSLMTLADHVGDLITRWEPDACFVDAGGMGQGVVDRLHQKGYDVVHPIDFGSRALNPVHFQNRRVEMWWLMAQAVKRELALPKDDDLRRDLTVPTFDHMGASDRMSLESKDELRKRGEQSPDCGDALALTYAQPVAMRSQAERMAEKLAAIRGASQGGRNKTRFEYDPLEGF